MIIVNIIIPLLFFFLLYLGIQIFKVALFFIYLTQLKEYRFDRIRVHFSSLSGKNDIKDYFNLLKWRKFHRPKFTLRSFLVLLFTLALQYNFFFFALRFSFRHFKNFPWSVALMLIVILFLINLLTPLMVFLGSAISLLIVLPFKKIIIKLASLKINYYKNLMVVGITGSFGKTATKEILAFILEDFFRVIKTPNNCNTQVGIAKVILKKLKRSHEIFIVEMGAYKKGEIAEIAKMVRPKIGIITGINEQHLALFGSITNTQWAKFELIKSLPKEGLAVFNANNTFTRRLFKAAKNPKILYGQSRIRLKTKLIGDWQKENIEAALAVTDYLKIPRLKVFERLSKINKISLGVSIKRGNKGTVIIDDSYNSNPKGFSSALDLLKKTSGRKKILVTPGIIELGKAAERIHKLLGRKASKICTKIFLTKPDIEAAVRKGSVKKRKDFIEFEADEAELLEKLKAFLSSKTVILAEGRIPAIVIKKLCSIND